MEQITRPRPAAYSILEACRQLTISRTTLYRLIDDGKIRRVKLGKRALIPSSEIDRILAGDETDAA